jgi:aspartate/methionine/tyrosine aminotransferase
MSRTPIDSVFAERIRPFGETIFAEMTALANQYQAVNLGQGFPNFPCPDFVKSAVIEAIQRNHNQYARGMGSLALVKSLARLYSPLFQRDLNPLEEIVVSVGATEGIFAACQAFLNPGDEVILFEPFYDSYPASVTMAGGIPVYLPLKPNEQGLWSFSKGDLEKAFSPRTKVNYPQLKHVGLKR